MDSEEPVEGEVVSSVSQELQKEPESETSVSAVEPSTESTGGHGEERQGEEPETVEVMAPEPKEHVILQHSDSGTPAEEEPSVRLLVKEDSKQAKNSQVPGKSTLSQTSVDADAALPGKLSSLTEDEFEEFINSPRGQNVIVETSPGGRYVRFMEKLGSGASKDVYRAYDTTEGIEVAWNVVNLAGVPKAERNRIVNEVRLLERLHHHNIISFHGSWVNRERQEVNFVTEILSSGTLKSFIDKVQVIRWKIAKRWARQILAGLAYLHEQDPPVIHRDLKCDNIFINGTSGDLRIGDLGLSTVHRNGKVLSVLGTPEFMAPDLYEETSYDEKVDIYAFGMALLEIFTKDIPYRECANPAQIYKRVMRGDPPESLARVRSKEARDFITLCLGYQDEETGKYIRPTAAELLNHPFLGAGADDESEVEVDPPLRERAIREEGGNSDPQRRKGGVTTKMEIPAPPAGPPPVVKENTTDSNPTSPLPNRSPVPPRRDGVPPRPNPVYGPQSSLDDDSDQFEEMPDSEVNIVKKVKVMMGRGQELESTEGELSSQAPALPASTVAEQAASTKPDEGSAASSPSTEQQISPPQSALPHYLVAAAVIEEESPLVRPYKDDILKLIIRLPVEGQTQNVQFDFHLIQDDPVQVAKEMVSELGIPQEAVLEISETISGHARTARMKQEKHSSRQKWQQDQQMAQNVQGQGMQQPQPGGVPQQPQQVSGNEGYPVSHPQMPPPAAAGQQPITQPQAPSQGQFGEGPGQQVPPPPQVLSSRSLSGGQLHQPVYTQPPAGGVPQDGNVQPVQMQQAPQHRMVQQAQVPVQQAQTPVQKPVSHEMSYQGVQYAATPTQVPQAQPTGQVPIPTQPEAPSTFVQPQAPPFQPSTVAPPAADATVPHGQVPPHDAQPTPLVHVHENGGTDQVAPATRPLAAVESASDGVETNEEDDGDDERELKEEIRRLDEDFQKNMLRAQKVFDSRMDNLQRSKEEREAQHLKTLEKHEKERAEFEKRLQQAEKEQNRRIEQLQREWDKKRESLAKHKGAKKKPAAGEVSSVPPGDERMSELTQANAESLGTMVSSTGREGIVPPTHKKSASMNNSESSQRSRSSSSTSLNGDSGSNSDHGVTS